MSLRIGLGSPGPGLVRYSSDAVWETAASLRVFAFPHHHAVHTRLRRLLPRGPGLDTAFLSCLLAEHDWLPDLLSPVPRLDPPTPLEQFEDLRRADGAVAEADLSELRRRRPQLVDGMTPEQYVDTVVSQLTTYWRTALRDLWDRVEAITAQDLAHQQRTVARLGTARALEDVHHKISCEDGRVDVALVSVDHSVDAPVEGIWLVPSVFRWPWVGARWDADAVVISYAARGPARLWESPAAGGGADALAALLGRTRATILRRLRLPRSTTWLARDLDLSMSTVSGHLSVLTDSGLLTAGRDGRSVLYSQTELGSELAEGGRRAW